MPRKYSVLGTDISATNYGEVLRLCRQWISRRRRSQGEPSVGDRGQQGRCIFVCTVNAVMTGVFQPEFRTLLNRGDIATTDGMPLAWALRSFGERGQPRVYGPDLMLALCGQAVRLGHRVFLFGGREEVIPELCRRLRWKFPGLDLAGTYPYRDPPLTPELDRAALDEIRNSGADIVFVGFGQPRQEQWMLEHRDQLPGVVMVGVGAAFDFHAGRVNQSPRWMQERGLEWLYRLGQEPGRLWRRYLLLNPLFLVMWGLQLTGLLRYRTPAVPRTASLMGGRLMR